MFRGGVNRLVVGDGDEYSKIIQQSHYLLFNNRNCNNIIITVLLILTVDILEERSGHG